MRKRIKKDYVIPRRQVYAYVWEQLKGDFTMDEVAENFFRTDVGNFWREIVKAEEDEDKQRSVKTN